MKLDHHTLDGGISIMPLLWSVCFVYGVGGIVIQAEVWYLEAYLFVYPGKILIGLLSLCMNLNIRNIQHVKEMCKCCAIKCASVFILHGYVHVV